jgi:nitrite reductase (NADH) large subunit
MVLVVKEWGRNMTNRIIIIGNGIAGITALKAIREVDKDSEIIMFGEEKFYPYNRIKLSKSLFDELSEDNILLQKKDWYEQNKINLCIDKKVTKIHIETKEVVLSDESVFKYDKLLLVNGASNNRLPIEGIEKHGVFTLRTLQDAWDIKDQIKKGGNAINIGGGIQGLETAWNLQQHGIKVSIMEVQSRLMPNQLDERASQILQESVEKFGVTVHLNTRAHKIIGGHSVEGVVTNSGELFPCEEVIYAVGIKSNIEIAENTVIKCGKGIIVNEKMETNIEDIYAAGDVVEFKGNVSGLWNISIGQGKVAGYNIANKDSTYQEIVPVTTLNAFKLSLFSMGCVDESKATNILVEENDEGQYIKVFIRESRIVGAIVIGDTKRSPIFKAAIEKESSLEAMDLSKISVSELLNNIQNKK